MFTIGYLLYLKTSYNRKNHGLMVVFNLLDVLLSVITFIIIVIK